MPILRTKEIRDMSLEDRQSKLSELQTELIRLRTMVKAGGQVENSARIRELRKTIARVLTIDKEPVPVKKEQKKPKEKKKAKKQDEEKKAKTSKKKPKEGKEE